MRKNVFLVFWGFFLLFVFIGCGGENTTINPIYESLSINLSTVKVDTVKTIIGGEDPNQYTAIDIENAVSITYYGSGAIFGATVYGENNPLQTVIWEIVENVDKETNITNGLLTVAANDHGKIITVKAISTEDSSIFDTKIINIVSALPSDFYGKWQRPINDLIVWTWSINSIEAYDGTRNPPSHRKFSPVFWMPVMNDGSNENISIINFPCGFRFTTIVFEVISGYEIVGEIRHTS